MNLVIMILMLIVFMLSVVCICCMTYEIHCFKLKEKEANEAELLYKLAYEN